MNLLARTYIMSFDIQDVVSINIKGNFNLRYALGHWWDAVKYQSSQKLVINCHRFFSLKNVKIYACLVIMRRC